MGSRKLSRHAIDIAIARMMEDIKYLEDWTADDWLVYGEIPKEFKDIPSAIEAKKIMDSPLYKALEETEDGTEFISEEET